MSPADIIARAFRSGLIVLFCVAPLVSRDGFALSFAWYVCFVALLEAADPWDAPIETVLSSLAPRLPDFSVFTTRQN